MRSLKHGHQARAETETGQEGSALARAIAVVALIAGVALVVVTLFGNGDGYRYKMLFQTGGQLVPGNQVLVAGQPIGTIDSMELTDDAEAEVDVTLDRPLLEGSTAQFIKSGTLPALRVGKNFRIRARDLAAYLDASVTQVDQQQG